MPYWAIVSWFSARAMDSLPSYTALDHLANAQALRPSGRAPHRLAPRSTGNDNDEILGLIDDRDQCVLAILVDPHGEERSLRFSPVFGYSPGPSSHLEQGHLNILFFPASRRDVLSVFRSEHNNGVSLGIEIIAAVGRHGIRERSHNLDWVRLDILGHAVRSFRINDGDDAVVGVEPTFDMERLPGIGGLMLRDAIGVLPRV